MLTQKEVDNFKGKMRCDGNGLYLNKKQSGSMFWVYRYTLNGRYDMYIGEVCKPPRGESDAQAKERRDGGRLTLAEARIERDKWRDFVKQGRDPKAVRDTQIEVERLARAKTVAVVAQDWAEERKKTKAPNTIKQDATLINTHIIKHIGDRTIVDVEPSELIAFLKKIASKKMATANLIQGRLKMIWQYAVIHQYTNRNIVNDIHGVIPRAKHDEKQELNDDELIVLFERLNAYRRPITPICFKLQLHTMVRPSEIREAEWSEFDLDEGVWTIPASRMKKRKAHKVPITEPVLTLLVELAKMTGSGKYLFPNERDYSRPIGATTINRMLEYIGQKKIGGKTFSAHGTRVTASSWLNKHQWNPLHIEMQLAHKVLNPITHVYNKHEALPERAEMLDAWSEYLVDCEKGKKRNVVPIRQRRGGAS